MRRRRLIVVTAVLAAVTAGVAWLSVDRLSPEERAIVGVWWWSPRAGTKMWMEFREDRSCRIAPCQGGLSDDRGLSARWAVRDGRYVIDYELSRVRRALRPAAAWVGVTVAPAYRAGLEQVTGNEFVLVGSAGQREVWTRSTGMEFETGMIPTESR